MDCHFIWALILLSIHSYRIWDILKKRMASKLSDEDKNKKVEGDNIYVITVCGASNTSVNGVYVATPCIIIERNR